MEQRSAVTSWMQETTHLNNEYNTHYTPPPETRGRPRKYANDDERREADKLRKRESRRFIAEAKQHHHDELIYAPTEVRHEASECWKRGECFKPPEQRHDELCSTPNSLGEVTSNEERPMTKKQAYMQEYRRRQALIKNKDFDDEIKSEIDKRTPITQLVKRFTTKRLKAMLKRNEIVLPADYPKI
jgi:hypothetical protein